MISRSLSYYIKYKLYLYNQPYTCLHTNHTFYIIKAQFERQKGGNTYGRKQIRTEHSSITERKGNHSGRARQCSRRNCTGGI